MIRTCTAAFVLALLLLAASAAAQTPKNDSYLKNIELCNRMDRTALDARISGCTVLIDAGYGTTAALAIAFNNRGNAYIAKGDFDRAIQDFDKSIRLDRTYTKPLNNRGVAYMKRGEHDLAIEAFDEAIKLKPDYGNAFANRAAAYLKKHDYARAAQDYAEAIRLDPHLAPVWHGHCWARAILGELQAALEACNKALQSGLNHAATYDSLGLIHLKMDQPGAAIDDYSAALRLDPKLASALYGRGLARMRAGDQAGGDADISAAKTITAGIGDDFARYGVRLSEK
jgi:tetratricopeptide (TPR) repeat protein